jgi:hypothetical protein
MKLRRFNDQGIAALSGALEAARQGLDLNVTALIDDPNLSSEVDPEITIVYEAFPSRLEAGEYFRRVLKPLGPEAYVDVGLWAWLSAVWAPTLARDGKQVGRDYRWILEPANHQTYYRHLLAFPANMSRVHGGDASVLLVLLAGPLDSPGELNEQLGSVQEIAGCRSLLKAATALYVNPLTKAVRRGAASKGPGSARRLREVIGQFVLTWDFYEMDSESILRMLPPEFDRFLPAT